MKSRFAAILALGTCLMTCAPVYSMTPPEQKAFRQVFSDCIGKPCETEMYDRYGIVCTVTTRGDAGVATVEADLTGLYAAP